MGRKINQRNVPLESAQSTAHLDLNKAYAAPLMPKLKPTTVTVNLRMPIAMVNELKVQANKQDVPYQSYMKMLLARALKIKMA